jgi:Zn-dependent peptidase ImmA (M78 family)
MGHYFLNHSGDRRRNPDKSIYVNSKERIEEDEANIFASYFLVPTDLALECQTAEEIACKFQVSNRAAEIAFERVERVRRRLSGKSRELPPSVVDFLQEAKRRGHTVKTTISD